MQCPRCRTENAAGRRFCGECGQSLAGSCPSCGFVNQGDVKFCGGCGAAMTAVAPSLRPAPSPESYTPQHLAARILTSRTALGGERKQVTVLFADLKGSMELLADRDPEEARKLLDPVLERMMEAVHRYEGTVNQVMGDGIMALFGAPLAHEDHAVRACYAAIRMQDAINRYAERVRKDHGVTLRIRVGLHSGEVVVRSIDSDLRMDYSAVGQTTHLAARMEQLADPGTTLLTAKTLALAEGFVRVTALGPMAVKGLPAPVDVYELAGLSTVRSRFQAAAARGLSRFVGRDAEVTQLRRTVEHAGQGRGQVAAIVGEAGVGKSRLTFELIHSHRMHGWVVLQTGCVSHGKSTAYLPVVQLLRTYFDIEATDDSRRLCEKVTAKVLSLDHVLEPILPALFSLLDVAAEDEDWERLDPPQRRRRILDGVKVLLLRQSQVQPLLVVFEDLHWVDTETQALLDSLVESLPAARLLLLVNYRPEYSHSWGNRSYYRQLAVDPLPQASAETLLDTLLGEDAALTPLKTLLIERAAGNPFFIEEIVRSLIETGVLAGDRGAYRPTRVVQELHVPATAHAMLAARIDRLGPDHKRLLQQAAVIGTDVPLSLLEAIADDPDGIRQGLSHLQATEFLYETRLSPDIEYTFKHALTHEVAYASLVHAERQPLHAKVVTASEELYVDRLDEHVERLAHHAVRGEMWERAVTYSQRAGGKAFTRSANAKAATYYEEALSALARLPETRETLQRGIALRFEQRNAVQLLGQIPKAIELARDAERIARILDDRRALAVASTYLSNSVWMAGRSSEARVLARDAVSAATSLDDPELVAAANLYLGGACLTCGDLQAAMTCHRDVVRGLHGRLDRQRSTRATSFWAPVARSGIAMALAEAGRFMEAASEGEEAVRAAEDLDHPHTRAWAYWGIATVHLWKGDLERTLGVVDRAFALAREWDLRLWFAYLSWYRGRVCTLAGRAIDGLALLHESLKIYAERTSGTWEALVIAHLSEAQSLAGRTEDALTSAHRALALSRERGERSHEAHALLSLGRMTAQRPDLGLATAGTHFRDALTLGNELGLRPLVAHCHAGLAELHCRAGQAQQGARDFTTATAMYRTMGMTYWLEKAEREKEASTR